MAQATHNPAVTETKVVEVTPENITLVLSMEEAAAIYAVVGNVVGSSNTTMRKHTDSVFCTLEGIVDERWSNLLKGKSDASECYL